MNLNLPFYEQKKLEDQNCFIYAYSKMYKTLFFKQMKNKTDDEIKELVIDKFVINKEEHLNKIFVNVKKESFYELENIADKVIIVKKFDYKLIEYITENYKFAFFWQLIKGVENRDYSHQEFIELTTNELLKSRIHTDPDEFTITYIFLFK